MTGKAMSLIANGAFTDNMVILPGAMDNHLTNGALRLHMYLFRGSTPEQNSAAICKRFGNAINTKAIGTECTPPSIVSFMADSQLVGVTICYSNNSLL